MEGEGGGDLFVSDLGFVFLSFCLSPSARCQMYGRYRLRWNLGGWMVGQGC
jgi:hypothetical protein